MSTQFPTDLDSLTNPGPTDPMDAPGLEHDVQHTNLNDIVEAIQAKVGVDGSAVATSLDYLTKVAVNPGHTHSVYSVASHDHAGVYSVAAHDHAGVYAVSGHDHAGVYSALGHDHAGVYAVADHNHADVYSALGHDHAGVYSVASHDHAGVYSVASHDHAGVYSVASHDHTSISGIITVNAASQLVGINQAVPTAVLHILGAPNIAINILSIPEIPDVSSADAAKYRIGVDAQVIKANIGSGISDTGFRYGIRSDVCINDANFYGSLTSQAAIIIRHGVAACAASGARTVANTYGILVQQSCAAGATVTNSYGFYLGKASPVTGTVTNDWAIYQINASSMNALCGNTRIGSAALPTVALDVAGACKISTDLTVTGGMVAASIGIGSEPVAPYALYVAGSLRAKASFATYTVDGLWHADARPCVIGTPGTASLLIGYQDAGAGQYQPSLGFPHPSGVAYTGNLRIIGARVVGETDRFYITHKGVLAWSDGTGAADLSLFRQAAGILATGGSFQGGHKSADGTSGVTATYSIRNGANSAALTLTVKNGLVISCA